MIDTLRGTAAFAFIVLNTLVWCLPIYSLGLIRPLLPPAAARALGTWMVGALGGWVFCARGMIAALGVVRVDSEVSTAGDGADATKLRRDGWYLMVCNHQSWADILVLVTTFYGRLPQFRFFTKRELIWVPFIGIALRLLGFPFVRRYGREQLQANPALGEIDRRATLDACVGFRERPTTVLSFLEGTRFTSAKREAQRSPFEALLKPKIGGFALVLDGLADRLDAVVDVTIIYPSGAPSFWGFLCGRCPTARLHVRALTPPAADRDAIRDWVDRLWREKDQRLADRPSA